MAFDKLGACKKPFLVLSVLLCAVIGLTGCGGTGAGGPGGSGGTGGEPNASSAHPPFRTRYLRTDLQYSPNALQFFPPHLTAYDSVHHRFFVSNTTNNRIDVFDAAGESQISSIIVPLPFGLDVTPDGSKLYVVTTFGDVYLIDPAAMTLVQRFPSSTLGPSGYQPTQALILADGRLALMGSFGGFYFDGSRDFAIWDPVPNSLQVISASSFVAFGQFALSGDRTKVLLGGASEQDVMLYDPSTGSSVVSNLGLGTIVNILPTPDGKRFFVLSSAGAVVLDANTLELLGTFETPCGFATAVLTRDGLTLYCSDLFGTALTYDTSTLAQTGWIRNFNVLDDQQSIAFGAIDETGLIAGPIGHGVAFLDTRTQKNTAGTDFSIGFLSPGTGSADGGTSVQVGYSVGPDVTLTNGTVYIGNGTATHVSFQPTFFSAVTPSASFAGAADLAVVLPDGSLQMMPENFSYGPTIVEVSTNAASAEGGAQGVIFGYGFGQSAAGVQVSIGGQSAQVLQVIPSVAPIFPYPFPMGAILFTVPPGTAGASATVNVTTSFGSASATNAFSYVPALQSFPLPGSSLQQGVYDPTRSVLYFTDRNQIEVFSPSAHNWLAPIAISFTNGNSSLVGISLSPDGNTLAVADAGNHSIYVLNPSSPNNVKSFNVNTGSAQQPYGLAATNTGFIYYGVLAAGNGELNKLDTTNGVITNLVLSTNKDPFMRVILTSDGTRAFANDGSAVWIVDTADDSVKQGGQVITSGDGDDDLAVSADGNAAIAFDLLTDGFLNVATAMTYVDRDVWLPLAVYGQKLNADGTLIFQPLTDGIDIHDGASGLLRNRVQLPIQLSNVYDAVALDNADDLLFAITSTGIAQIDLRSLETMSSSLSFPKRGPAGPRMNVQQGHASYSRRPLSNENFLGLPRLRRRNPRLTPEKVQ